MKTRWTCARQTPELGPPVHRSGILGSATGACIAAAVLLSGTPTLAQDVTEPALKAAYIYNFAKFTDWPASVVPPAQPLVMCVLGDSAVSDALARAVKDRELAGHLLRVSPVTLAGTHRGCHILYVSGVTAAQATSLITGLGEAPVLTISDVEGFTELGGVAQFYFDHGRLRFAVHAGSIKRTRLQISSRLLTLAKQKK